MTIKSTALGIASLGRHGDDMIVHMNRDEVHGLQALAQQHGTSLTINPHTGMPEAFKLGNLFKSLIPMAAAWMFPEIPGLGFLGSNGIATGALTGAALAGFTGGNPLMGAITGGMGGYTGAGLHDIWSKMGGLEGLGSKAATDINASVLKGQGINTIAGNPIVPATTIPTSGNIGQALEANVNNLSSAIPKTQTLGGGLGTVSGKGIDLAALYNRPGSEILSGLESTGGPGVQLSLADSSARGLTNPSLYERYVDAGGTLGKIAVPAAGLLASGLNFKEKPIDYASAQPKKRIQTGTDASGNPTYDYVPITAYDPRETLNLNNPYENYSNIPKVPGLVLPPTVIAKEGGAISSYAMGGTVTTGGLRDLYSATDTQSNPQLSRDGYGVGRLDSLARAQSMEQAQSTGYAMGGLTAFKHGGPSTGGYLDGEGDGMSDSIPATIEGKQPARLADGEFVVPADVVSHLGNGSSKAGSKKLYAMMQKVRKARTGNPKQGKEINPEKYMPA
jgi:hypothetical protein